MKCITFNEPDAKSMCMNLRNINKAQEIINNGSD